MAMSRISAAAAVGFAVLASAQTSNQHGGVVTCQGREFPTWDACDNLFYWMAETPYRAPQPGICSFFNYQGEVNCVVSICWNNEASDDSSAFSSDINRAYQHIKGQCDPVNAGGSQPWYNDGDGSDAWAINVRNDPDYPNTSARKTSQADAFNTTQLLGELAVKSETPEDGIQYFELTTEDAQMFEEAEAAYLEEHRNSPSKRQDNDEFVLISQSFAITKPGVRTAVGGTLTSGVEYTWQSGQSQSVSTTITSGVSAGFWEVFTASVEISTTEEYSVEYSESYTFTSGNCPNRGQNYLYPLYDRYHGYVTSNPGENIDVWVPRGGDDIESPTLEYFIDIECLG